MASVSIERVTPEMAREWLEHNKGNRKISAERVASLVRQLYEDRFHLSPDAIAFDADGRLYNGQHRLTAIVEAECSAVLIVLRDAPSNAFLVTDIGMKKSGAHALHTLGYDGCSNLSAIARYVTSVVRAGDMKTGLVCGEAVTPEEIIDTVKAFPDLPKHHVDAGRCTSSRDKLACTRTAAALALWYATQFEMGGQMLEFMERAAEGVGLQENSPELALRRRLSNMRQDKRSVGNMATREQVALIVKAFNKRGKKMSVLQWKDAEDFPTIE